MKKTLPFLLYPMLGLLAGWISAAMESTEKHAQTPPQPARSIGNDRETRPTWTGEDFYQAALKRVENFSSPSFSPLEDLLADWTDEEIRAALDEAIKDPETLIHNGGTAGTLLREYMRRDLDAAIGWFSTLPKIHQANLASTLSHAWPESRAMDGLKFIREQKSLFESASASPWSILVKCIAETAAQGPDAVVAFLKQAREEGFSLDFGNPIAFPEGFDFGLLLGADDFQALNLGEMKQAIIAAWREKDREAAFDWVLEHGDSRDFQALVRYGPDWASNTRSWLIGKLDRTTPEQRAPLIEHMTHRWMGSGNEAAIWIENAATPELKMEIRTATAQGLFSGQPSAAIEVVEKMPEVEERLRFLESLTPSKAIGNRIQPLNANNESLLRRKLEEWGTDSARAEALVNRYRNPMTP